MSTSVPGNLVSLPVPRFENAPVEAEQETMIGTFPQYYAPVSAIAPFRAVLLATVAGALLWVVLFKGTALLMHYFQSLQ